MSVMADELRDEGRRIRGLATGLGVVSMAMMTAATATLTFDGPEWLMIGLAAGFALFAAVAVGALLIAGREPRPNGLTARREVAQWRRWQNCLYAWPLVTTNFALMSVYEMRRPDGSFFALFLPLFALVMLQQILPTTRGERGTFQRRQYEDLVDDLSREHAAAAFRSGYFILLAGGSVVLAAAIYAPAWTAEAAVAAIWLGFVAPCVQFGLLQRAAERES